jgi:hypothetical protein
VSALTVTQVSLASAPNGVKYYASHVAPPYSAVLRVNEDLGGVMISVYVWFSHPLLAGQPDAREDSLAAVGSVGPAAGGGPARYLGQYQHVFPISRGHVISLGTDSTQLGLGNSAPDLVRFGVAASKVASVAVTPNDGGPIPGNVLFAPGFPYKVWMIAFPALPDWTSTLTFRDDAGTVLASGPWVGDMTGSGCHPIASLDYAPPRGASAFSVGLSLPEVTTVTAVLPDGQQINGGFLRVPIVQQYYREWQVTYPRADAGLTVKLVFRNAGQVVDTLSTVPGKNPFSLPKSWW